MKAAEDDQQMMAQKVSLDHLKSCFGCFLGIGSCQAEEGQPRSADGRSGLAGAGEEGWDCHQSFDDYDAVAADVLAGISWPFSSGLPSLTLPLSAIVEVAA